MHWETQEYQPVLEYINALEMSAKLRGNRVEHRTNLSNLHHYRDHTNNMSVYVQLSRNNIRYSIRIFFPLKFVEEDYRHVIKSKLMESKINYELKAEVKNKDYTKYFLNCTTSSEDDIIFILQLFSEFF